ncbi:MAG: hypothetical protein ACLSUM_15170 [Dysosmobacter welbionis]
MKTQIPLPKRSGKPFWRQTSFIGKISDFPGRDRLCLPHIPGCAPNMEGQSDNTDNWWNIGLEDVRSMLEQGKQYDLKKKLSRKKDGEAR